MGEPYLVGTPIGNLEDMTCRAIYTLQHGDRIPCASTRVTAEFVRQFGLTTRLQCAQAQNPAQG
ncbi:rRNA (cytidine-2'-O-)-methyltransferase, partial [Staphylococcus pseudintermedius]